jgi:2-polyprenyl-3-methyl-5-hydroxy-6-metoxy-1,4-benzoquinol methylase
MANNSKTTQDPANGYETHAAEFRHWREQSSIGVATVLQWAQDLAPGAAVLDLGCGSGLPLGKALADRGFRLYGVDASPALAAAYQQLLPQAQVACERLEDSDFFQRQFAGVLCVGVLFLLPEASQRQLFRKVATALAPGGLWLFSAPAQPCCWVDVLTGQESVSLGMDVYQQLLQQAGLQLLAQYHDEGGNHYIAAQRPVDKSSPG